MPKPLLILYATVTGNAESCAESLADTARQHGYEPRVQSLAGYAARQLAGEVAVLFSVSTYGAGDPPDPAEVFWDELQRLPAGALHGVNYAIYALGDSSYVEFCGFGKKLDAELADKGACCFAERADNDLDYEAGFDRWCSLVFLSLPRLAVHEFAIPR